MKTLKPFNLEAAKNGAKVVTRDGRPVRIICYDRKNEEYPIVTLVGEDEDAVFSYSSGGRYLEHNDHDLDLFMAPIKREGWVNMYQCKDGIIRASCVFETKDEARLNVGRYVGRYLATNKVEWEE